MKQLGLPFRFRTDIVTQTDFFTRNSENSLFQLKSGSIIDEFYLYQKLDEQFSDQDQEHNIDYCGLSKTSYYNIKSFISNYTSSNFKNYNLNKTTNNNSNSLFDFYQQNQLVNGPVLAFCQLKNKQKSKVIVYPDSDILDDTNTQQNFDLLKQLLRYLDPNGTLDDLKFEKDVISSSKINNQNTKTSSSLENS